jgi:hypothetical protein
MTIPIETRTYAAIEFGEGRGVNWQPPPPPKRSGPKTAWEVKRVKEELSREIAEKRWPDRKRTRKEWVRALGTSLSSYDRAVRQLRDNGQDVRRE